MRIGIFTHDMTDRNRHLMPWRTIDEVARNLSRDGHPTTLVSLDREHPGRKNDPRIDHLWHLPKAPQGFAAALAETLAGTAPDVVFWPLTWRDALQRVQHLAGHQLPLVGYFGGGTYRPLATLYATWRLGLAAARPYLLEAFWPKQKRVRQWQQCGFKRMLALTRTTAEQLQRAGWPAHGIDVIPPGRETPPQSNEAPPLPAVIAQRPSQTPYFLFSGPPSRIRGIWELLDAFDRLADRVQDVDLVCLFRADAALDRARIQHRIAHSIHHSRIHCTWQSVTVDELQAAIRCSRAVVLPFVLVPSEIPLTLLDVMAQGRPVITTRQGGSGEFAAPHGIVVESYRPSQLARAMQRLLEDDTFHQARCQTAARDWAAHPDWPSVATQWLASATRALGHQGS